MNDKPRDVTAEEIVPWYTPRQAIEYAMAMTGNYSSARDAIWNRITGGLIECAASFRTISEPGKVPYNRTDAQLISVALWTRYSENNSDFWSAGDATFPLDRRSMYDKPTIVRYLGIKLNPADVHSTIPVPHGLKSEVVADESNETQKAPNATILPAKVNRGGRPPKSWWQDFWVEMCCRVFDGDIQPTSTQAAILEQMQQWVSDHDHEAGETVIKEAAQKLARALKSRSET